MMTIRTAAATAASVIAARAADPLYTRPDAAAYLGVAPGTLEVWACTGRYNLPYLKIGALCYWLRNRLMKD